MTYPDTATAEGRDTRVQQIISEHVRKSKRTGDHHFRMAESWGQPSDYVAGQDDGEPPQGARW